MGRKVDETHEKGRWRDAVRTDRSIRGTSSNPTGTAQRKRVEQGNRDFPAAAPLNTARLDPTWLQAATDGYPKAIQHCWMAKIAKNSEQRDRSIIGFEDRPTDQSKLHSTGRIVWVRAVI
jgi:hypothetical protein